MQALFDNFKKFGGEAAEINYQYEKGSIDEEALLWINTIKEYSESIGLLNTGGVDTHGNKIFHRR